MKALHFYAVARHPKVARALMSLNRPSPTPGPRVAGHPKVARALMTQAWTTLRPFKRFLGQAIHTAKERQVRYQLPWSKVRHLITLRLAPVDTLLRVPRRPAGVVLADWPAGKGPDLQQHGFVKNRGLPFRVESATPVGTGLRVQADVALQAGDQVVWCGLESSVQLEPPPAPPRQVTDAKGRQLKLLREARADGDGHWLLAVEGKLTPGRLRVEGEEVEPEILGGFEELSSVTDAAGNRLDARGSELRVEELPAEGPLRGDNGLRYEWSKAQSGARQGCWVQLHPPESLEADEFLDPRAAFCESELGEVWTQPRRNPETIFQVRKVDSDRYQLLLDRYPPENTKLHLPVDLRNLYLQKRALRQLAEAPLPHHQGLLRLCEDPQKCRWPTTSPQALREWRSLTDLTRSGTEEQRDFVQRALGTPDFAFLEGPPGSGKTTAICEIIQQLVEQGQRVLLCASTHVAIDNVLERLLGTGSPIDAVRIGKRDKVDDKVQATQLDRRVEALLEGWRKIPELAGLGELEEMAQRTVIMAANLTCGTTMGIVNHPLFWGRDEDLHISERPISTLPHWDVLIVDEASKTLIQEFLVPALMAKRWIIVGDVRQLPPFADRADLVANLRDLVDEQDRPLFPLEHQRACLLRFRLLRQGMRQPGLRWLLVERPAVLESLARELEARPEPNLQVVRVLGRTAPQRGPIATVTLDQLRDGHPEALRVAAADWVLVEDGLLEEAAPLLPGNLLLASDLTKCKGRKLPAGNPLLLRQAWWLDRQQAFSEPVWERGESFSTPAELQPHEQDWLEKHDWAGELAWRLTRVHELRHSGSAEQRKRLKQDMERLLPAAAKLDEPVSEIEDIGLPSILEVLQEGIGAERSWRRSALTCGFRTTRRQEFEERFGRLSFQHRMHAEIASFSRDIIYAGQALKDANTIQSRDATLGWDFGPFPSRRVWLNVEGREQGGVNAEEIKAMEQVLREFVSWARRKGKPARALPAVWEVACLCFYVKQERAIADMLRTVTGDTRKTRFTVPDAPIEIVCGTVDRFQGREADLVLLSLRNTRRTGFLDSPNRLNVAVTRARQQLVVVGHHEYFSRCGIHELEELARRTPRTGPHSPRFGRTSPR